MYELGPTYFDKQLNVIPWEEGIRFEKSGNAELDP